MKQRLDLYRNVHKGIRVMLFDLVQKAGRIDFTDAAALENLRNEARNIFELLESHAHTEDTFVMPLVEKHSPVLAKEFAAAHGEQESLLPRVLDILESIDPASSDAAAKGHSFVLQFSRIAGDLLIHMADEELEINGALWNAMSDEELGEVERRLVGSFAPDKLARYLRWMIPAMNPAERVAFLGHVPPPVFGFVRGLASEVLSAEDDARLEQDLGVAVA